MAARCDRKIGKRQGRNKRQKGAQAKEQKPGDQPHMEARYRQQMGDAEIPEGLQIRFRNGAPVTGDKRRRNGAGVTANGPGYASAIVAGGAASAGRG